MSPRRTICPRFFVAAFVLLASSRAHAQEVLLDVPGPGPGSYMRGFAIGDWDGDGIPDFAMGLPLDSTVAPNAGSVSILSGKDTSVLATIAGTYTDELFGSLVVSVPDLDADGLDDLAIAAPGASYTGKGTGTIYLHAGRTGALILRIDGPASALEFGMPFGVIGDVDGDGICDLFAAEGYGFNDVVHIVSGADGHEILPLYGAPGDLFGYMASALDDLDGDGVREILVGAPWYKGRRGAAYVISTASGSVLRTYVGAQFVWTLGGGGGELGDVDGDGVRDYALVRAGVSPNPTVVIVRSGATGAILAKIDAPWKDHVLMQFVVDVDDVNGDGVRDFALEGIHLTHPVGPNAPVVFLMSGKSFLPLDRIVVDTQDLMLQFFPTPRLDLDGDGLADFLVSSTEMPTHYGRFRVFSGDRLWQDAIPSEVAAGDTLELSTREGVPGALTLLTLEELDGVPTFQVIDVLATFDATGGRSLTYTIPAGLGVHDFTLRAYADDGAGRLIQSAAQVVSTQ